jgi:hypothetical protein
MADQRAACVRDTSRNEPLINDTRPRRWRRWIGFVASVPAYLAVCSSTNQTLADHSPADQKAGPYSSGSELAAPSARALAAGSQMARLISRLEQEIMDGRLLDPSDDNALSTFQTISALIPSASSDDLEIVIDIRKRFRSLAQTLEAGGKHEQAQRLFAAAEEMPATEATDTRQFQPGPASRASAPPAEPSVIRPAEPGLSDKTALRDSIVSTVDAGWQAIQRRGGPESASSVVPVQSPDAAPGASPLVESPSAPAPRSAVITAGTEPREPEGSSKEERASEGQPQQALITNPTGITPGVAHEESIRPATPTGQAALLLHWAQAMSARGDVAAARLLYVRAAAEGSAAAATGAGKTYDPICLAEFGARGLKADTKVAAIWYRKAIALGDQEAAPLLQQLNHLEVVQQNGTAGQAKATCGSPS